MIQGLKTKASLFKTMTSMGKKKDKAMATVGIEFKDSLVFKTTFQIRDA